MATMKHIVMTIALAAMVCGSAQAQVMERDSVISLNTFEQPIDSLVTDQDFLYHYELGDNWFVGGSVGMSHSLSENTRFGNFFEAQRPSFQAEIGKYFYPSFGMRLTLGYKQQKGRAEWEICELPNLYLKDGSPVPNHFGFYDFSIFTTYLDALINFTNIVTPYREHRLFNLVGILGLGYTRSIYFDDNKLDKWRSTDYYIGNPVGNPGAMPITYDVDSKNKDYLAVHIGLQGRFRLNDAWDLNAEVVYNVTDDAYNGVRFDRVYDTYFDMLVGVNYHFKDCHNLRRFRYINYDKSRVVEALVQSLKRENTRVNTNSQAIRRQVPVEQYSEQLQTTIQFYIDRYYITEAQKKNVKSVANFLEKHPDINLVVTGYADVETAYPKYNMQLSKRRANAVRDMLIKEYGVDPSRLELDYKGDVEQPYATVNEWNRAVVFRMKSKNSDNIYKFIEGGDPGKEVVTIGADEVIDPKKYAGNTNIKKVIIQKGVTEIPDGAFQGCWALEEVEFPEGLTRIGAKAFNGTILQIVTLPSTLEYIGDEAFINSSMVEVDIPSGHKPELGKNVLGTKNKFIMRVRVPASAISKFKADPEWRRCDNITNIGAYWNLK